MAAAIAILPRTIAVVTINWNGADNTIGCLQALRASAGARWHLYIVDNASADDSLERLADLGPEVTLIASPVNGGWTGGNNAGIRRALDDGYDHIFILNNDAFVRPDTLARLLAIFEVEQERMPVLGPVHKGVGSADYDFTIAHRDPKTGVPEWTHSQAIPETGRGGLNATAYISGAAILAHRRHFEVVGLLDDRFYLNFDDTDWCTRAETAGFPLLMARDVAVDHIGSATIGGRTSPLQTYFLARNRLLYLEKHGTARQRLRLWRRYIWQARALTGRDRVTGWLPALLRPRDPLHVAFGRGIIDYLRRRFGD